MSPHLAMYMRYTWAPVQYTCNALVSLRILGPVPVAPFPNPLLDAQTMTLAASNTSAVVPLDPDQRNGEHNSRGQRQRLILAKLTCRVSSSHRVCTAWEKVEKTCL